MTNNSKVMMSTSTAMALAAAVLSLPQPTRTAGAHGSPLAAEDVVSSRGGGAHGDPLADDAFVQKWFTNLDDELHDITNSHRRSTRVPKSGRTLPRVPGHPQPISGPNARGPAKLDPADLRGSFCVEWRRMSGVKSFGGECNFRGKELVYVQRCHSCMHAS
jgi:hypothetical protein